MYEIEFFIENDFGKVAKDKDDREELCRVLKRVNNVRCKRVKNKEAPEHSSLFFL